MRNLFGFKKYLLIGGFVFFYLIMFNNTIYCFSNRIEKKSNHFKFYYSQQDERPIINLIDYLEENYYRIIEDLELETSPTINVFFYDSYEEFFRSINVSSGPSWFIAATNSSNAIHMISPNCSELNRSYHKLDVLKNTILHEFVHCITFNIGKNFPNSARWFLEALAQYESGQFIHPSKLSYLSSGKIPSICSGSEWQNEVVIYEIGYLVIEYIVVTWGKESLNKILKSKGDIETVLNTDFSKFESAWYNYVCTNYNIKKSPAEDNISQSLLLGR